MAQAKNLKIRTLISDLEQNNYLLPAIQREFVWKPEKICALFESLMHDYPIGTFLFWHIPPAQSENYRFYAFLRYFHERNNNRCQLPDVIPQHGFNAVLDGQQRMTALFIGLKGTYSSRSRYGRVDDESAYPIKQLYINILKDPEKKLDSEEGQYAFEFKTEIDAKNAEQKGEWWFPCHRVCEKNWNVDDFCDEEVDDVLDRINFPIPQLAQNDPKKDGKKIARKIVRTLDRIVNRQEVLTYFEEETCSLNRVLNIFIRLNSGGMSLSYSDLLLSIAIAQWKEIDAREEINLLKDKLWLDYSFNLSKDFILKACLMLSDVNSIKFDIDNFNKKNTQKLEDNWEICKKYLTLVTSLLHSFGYNTKNLTATNAILPIAYYLKTIAADDSYLLSPKFHNDRKRIKLWLNRSILKQGIWGAGVDTFLSQLRETIRNEVPTKTGNERFPYEEIEKTMSRSGRSLNFVEEELDELLDLSYGNARTFTLLSLLFPTNDMLIQSLHVDHIFPQSLFGKRKKLLEAGYTESQIKESQWKRNTLPNLQLLPSTVNREKNDLMPLEWLLEVFSSEEDRAKFSNEQHLEGISNDPKDFFQFYDTRRETLKELIAKKLDIPLRNRKQ